ncbi:MAG: hypothetical protein SCM96_13820 [Acidobacteriota bacterium]|nr:hypothetical protein [Acidobacteriota bacterium]
MKNIAIFGYKSQFARLKCGFGGSVNMPTQKSGKINDIDAIIMFCHYECFPDLCSTWFSLLGKKPPIPIVLIRRIFINGGEDGGQYVIQHINNNDSHSFSNPDIGEWFPLFMNSLGLLKENIGHIPLYSPLDKVVEIQKKIIFHDGIGINRNTLARETEWSPPYLSFYFKKIAGMSLNEFMIKNGSLPFTVGSQRLVCQQRDK